MDEEGEVSSIKSERLRKEGVSETTFLCSVRVNSATDWDLDSVFVGLGMSSIL